MEKIRASFPDNYDGLTKCLGVSVAIIFSLMLLLQLFTFEKIPVIFSVLLVLDGGYASVIAGLIVIAELLSLPFLLGMSLSPLMRITSLVSGLFAVTFWYGIGLFTTFWGDSSLGTGIAGGKVILPGGVWLVCMMSAIFLMYVWYVVRSGALKNVASFLRRTV